MITDKVRQPKTGAKPGRGLAGSWLGRAGRAGRPEIIRRPRRPRHPFYL